MNPFPPVMSAFNNDLHALKDECVECGQSIEIGPDKQTLTFPAPSGIFVEVLQRSSLLLRLTAIGKPSPPVKL
jgi:hypothetical protein